MDFSEKLQALRKASHLTQEQLAEQLFVSRTAVSKWETGKGTPNIDSLKAIARLFHITIDELLSGEELLCLAETENQNNLRRKTAMFQGMLNLLAIAGLLLPLYKVQIGDHFNSVMLIEYPHNQGIIFAVVQIVIFLCGISELILLMRGNQNLSRIFLRTGDAFHIAAVFFFIAAQQPYPATLYFLLLLSKILLITRKAHIYSA